MTGDRQFFVTRSIAALDDRESIETRPLSAIKADLDKLGIDPRASIDRARKLAAKKSSPADRLMARLDDADAIDVEIEALEQADIDEVRGMVPSGVAAGVAADAKQRTGLPSAHLSANVTALKRSHRRVFGWGGSILGLVACLLLFVMIRPDQLYQLDQPVMEEAGDVAALSDTATTESDDIDKPLEASRGVSLEEKAGTADQALALGESRRSIEQPSALPRPEAEMALESLASQAVKRRHDLDENVIANPQATARLSKQEEREQADLEIAAVAPLSEPPHLPEAKPAVPADVSKEDVAALAPEATHRPKARSARPVAEETVASVLADDVGAVRRELDQLERGAASSNIIYPSNAADDWRNPKAVLIVDPEKAPLGLKVQAETLPTGKLADRLDEARRLAGDGDVVALVTVLREGEEVDAALTLRPLQPLQPRASFADVDAIVSFDAAPRVYDDGDVELIELPRKP